MKPVLTLIEELSAALDRENIRYCHWKSNEGIERSLSGDTDLDLLIDPEHRSQFSRLLFRLGFKGASNRKDARFPGLFHFYGYDKESKKFVDVHVHYRLIVGCDLIKNYELPFVRPYLDSVRDCHGLKVPAVEFEYLAFVIRMVLKRRWLAWIVGHPNLRIMWQAFSREGRPPLKGSEAREWRDFQSCVNHKEIPDLLAQHLPTVDAELFAICEKSLEPNARRWAWLTAGHTLCAALRSYQRHSTPAAVAHACYRRTERFTGMMSRQLPFQSYRHRERRRLVGGGRVVAFVGGDGSGKSTNLKAFQEWLGKILDVRTFHLGKPPLGPARIPFRIIQNTIWILTGIFPNAQVKPLQAMAEVLVARGRWRLTKAVSSAAKSGAVVLCDRFPLSEVKLSESPRIPKMNGAGRLMSWLDALEQSYYNKIDSLGLPHHIIVLRIDPQAAIDRKPEENPDFIRPRLQEIWDVHWNATGKYQVIDAAQPLENVLDEVRNGVWAGLS